MKKNVLAFDFGASSGRAILGKYDHGELKLEEIHRFSNTPVMDEGVLRWDFPNLMEQTFFAIKKASEQYQIDGIGVDTWGVDFGLLDQAGDLIVAPMHYRNDFIKGSLKEIEELMPKETLYLKSGIEIMEINTLFQLWSLKERRPELFEQAETMLLMPDLINYMLTGEKCSERSIASTTQLLQPSENKWNFPLIDFFGLPRKIFTKINQEGHQVGVLKKSFGFGEVPIFNVCEHDTASAVASIPAAEDFLFISCGTWSLVGTESDRPFINEKSCHYNITNEGGCENSTTFLKNCTGLWIFQEYERDLKAQGLNYSHAEIDAKAEESEGFKTIIDTDAAIFSTVGDMGNKIKDFALQTGQPIPENYGEITRTIFESLAFKYKTCILEIIDVIDKEFDSVYIIGGGSKIALLCQMVADATGLKVLSGQSEATAMGNIIEQLIALKVFPNIKEAREWLKQFYKMKTYFPQNTKQWEEGYKNYQEIVLNYKRKVAEQ